MARMFAWDYRRPYFYMVTLNCLPDLPPLSVLKDDAEWGYDPCFPMTRVLAGTIRTFVAESPGIESISPYILMPDHIHLLIKIADVPERLALGTYVKILKARLREAYCQQAQRATPLFQPGYHDLIVKKANQLANFRHYIRDNPKMRLLRQQSRDKFYCYRQFSHWRLGEQAFDLVGNPELLSEPATVAIRISRSVLEESAEWNKTMAWFDRWKPGMTAVGTWWSKGEQAAYQKILERGGNIILLSPEGFPERWHPTGQAQHHCAEGRLLYLSPYAPFAQQLPIGTLRQRCLALNALAIEIANRIHP